MLRCAIYTNPKFCAIMCVCTVSIGERCCVDHFYRFGKSPRLIWMDYLTSYINKYSVAKRSATATTIQPVIYRPGLTHLGNSQRSRNTTLCSNATPHAASSYRIHDVHITIVYIITHFLSLRFLFCAESARPFPSAKVWSSWLVCRVVKLA